MLPEQPQNGCFSKVQPNAASVPFMPVFGGAVRCGYSKRGQDRPVTPSVHSKEAFMWSGRSKQAETALNIEKP